MNERIRDSVPGRRLLIQVFGFAAGAGLIAYFAGYASVSSAAVICMVFSVFLLGSRFAGQCYPAPNGYRRSLPDTLKLAAATSLLFGVSVYLALFLMNRVEGLASPDGQARLVLLTAGWFGCTMFLEWFGREPRA
ncbi:hypothetical protein [Hoeflea sp.]|uniref:hypothetical protein n=1 Tax=Hoeflea sp. TaxID=1940281 RepID=UPI003B520AD5